VNRSDTITVNEAITEFIAHYKRNRRSWRQAQNRLERTAGNRWGHWPITDVTRREVKSVRVVLLRAGKPYESNQTVTLPRQFFEWAEDDRECISESPAATVKAKGETRERDDDHPSAKHSGTSEGLIASWVTNPQKKGAGKTAPLCCQRQLSRAVI